MVLVFWFQSIIVADNSLHLQQNVQMFLLVVHKKGIKRSEWFPNTDGPSGIPSWSWAAWQPVSSKLVFLPMLSSAPYLDLKMIVFRPSMEEIFQPSDAITWAPGQEEKAPEPNMEDLQDCPQPPWPWQRHWCWVEFTHLFGEGRKRKEANEEKRKGGKAIYRKQKCY